MLIKKIRKYLNKIIKWERIDKQTKRTMIKKNKKTENCINQ